MAKPQKQIDLSKLDKAMAAGPAAAADMTWHRPDEPAFRLSGFPWYEQDRVYRRLPVKPAWPLSEAVEDLANCTAGGQVRFGSTSRRVAVRVKLRGPAGMVHMPATGQCGFDLYVGPPGGEVFCTTATWPSRESEYEVTLFQHADARPREFTLNFPLYQGVNELSVGLDRDAELSAPSPYSIAGPIIFYGTSVTQGGCACRPGMAHTNILSRKLNAEVINLGFSGNGKGEGELAWIIAEIAGPALFVLDFDANVPSAELLQERLPVFIQILREKYALTPILVISRPPFAKDIHDAKAMNDRRRRAEVQKQAVEKCRQAGDAHIHFCDGSTLMGEDFHECTVDGVHPTDLGFWRMAENLEPVIRRILS